MKIDKIKNDSEHIQKLAKKGKDIVGFLKKYLKSDFAEHIKIEKETDHSLLVNYYGHRMIFRIEIGLSGNDIWSQILACSLSNDKDSKEIPIGVEYEFDTLGNVTGHDIKNMTDDSFSQYFIVNIFNKLTDGEGVMLKP